MLAGDKSHCAGIIAFKWDGLGTGGVASGVKLCVVRTSVGGGYAEANIVRAFLYLTEAVDNGLNLFSVNCSFGGDGFTNTELLMANELGKRGVVTCVASGNSALDNDESPITASDFAASLYSVIVNSSNANYLPSDFSDYGQTTTDVFSPRDPILAPVNSSLADYFASVDESRKYYEGFDPATDSQDQVKIASLGEMEVSKEDSLVFETPDEFLAFINNASEVGKRIADPESFDGDGYSYVVDIAPKASKNTREYFLVSIPVDENDFSEISHFSFALKSTLGNSQTYVRTIAFGGDSDNPEIRIDEIGSTGGWQRPSSVWTMLPICIPRPPV